MRGLRRALEFAVVVLRHRYVTPFCDLNDRNRPILLELRIKRLHRDEADRAVSVSVSFISYVGVQRRTTSGFSRTAERTRTRLDAYGYGADLHQQTWQAGSLAEMGQALSLTG